MLHGAEEEWRSQNHSPHGAGLAASGIERNKYDCGGQSSHATSLVHMVHESSISNNGDFTWLNSVSESDSRLTPVGSYEFLMTPDRVYKLACTVHIFLLPGAGFEQSSQVITR